MHAVPVPAVEEAATSLEQAAAGLRDAASNAVAAPVDRAREAVGEPAGFRKPAPIWLPTTAAVEQLQQQLQQQLGVRWERCQALCAPNHAPPPPAGTATEPFRQAIQSVDSALSAVGNLVG